MVTIIFESHSTSIDNEKHLSSGHYNVDLSVLGRQQAQDLSSRYENRDFAAVFCSDLQRSYKTAEIAFANRNFEIIRDARLRECDYGDLTRHPNHEVEPAKIDHIIKPFPNGESYEQASVRVKDFLKGLLEKYDGQTVMVIGHRATQYGLEHWLNKVPLAETVAAPWQWQPGWGYCLKKINS